MTRTPVGTRIRTARERKGWTQQDLAAAADLAIKTISVAENGGMVSRKSLRRMAEHLGLDFLELWKQRETELEAAS
jgi:transcriptional regulator with XRE-family HTH domain